MKPRELEKRLRRAGWRAMPGHGKGSHRAYHHPTIPGVLIIPWHESKDVKKGILRQILKKAGIE
ncbi:MAG: type II toxin-antitoxin system HicA family toxin [SAR324 cluster bacterium]|nr:type II toxin-antitoxin system HicA family toxin [SAR324 cluster bacterium]